MEGTSFTIGEPTEISTIAPLLYEYSTVQEKKVLSEKYGISSFPIRTISLERMYIDKLFAAEGYLRRSEDPAKAIEAAKHIYDLSVLEKNERIVKFLSDSKKMKKLLDIQMAEEQERHGGVGGVLPIEFTFFSKIQTTKNIHIGYNSMLERYVFDSKYKFPLKDIFASISRQEQALLKNSSWRNYKRKDIPLRAEVASPAIKNIPICLKPKQSKKAEIEKER